MGQQKEANIEYPFENVMVKLLITLWTVYQYTQSLQRYRRPSQLSCQRGRKLLRVFTMRTMVTLKQLQSLLAVMGENLGWIDNIVVTPQY